MNYNLPSAKTDPDYFAAAQKLRELQERERAIQRELDRRYELRQDPVFERDQKARHYIDTGEIKDENTKAFAELRDEQRTILVAIEIQKKEVERLWIAAQVKLIPVVEPLARAMAEKAAKAFKDLEPVLIEQRDFYEQVRLSGLKDTVKPGHFQQHYISEYLLRNLPIYFDWAQTNWGFKLE